MLTPHVGGSTEEAQQNIGTEVAEKLIKYSNNGSTLTAVNFPEVSLPEHPGKHGCCTFIAISRACCRRSTRFFPKQGSISPVNICKPTPQIGYVVIDIETSDAEASWKLKRRLESIAGTIRTRILY